MIAADDLIDRARCLRQGAHPRYVSKLPLRGGGTGNSSQRSHGLSYQRTVTPNWRVARARIGALDSEQWHSNTGNLGGPGLLCSRRYCSIRALIADQ
jgi:hypothetical protein